MKISIAILSLFVSISLNSIATATVWTDTTQNVIKFNNGHQDHTFIYDLREDASNPFHPGVDLITEAILSLNFSASGRPTKTASIKLDNAPAGSFTFFTDKDFDLELTALTKLNHDGTLQLDIHRSAGTFTLTDSILTARGTDNTPILPPEHGDDNTPSAAPVPEPGTLALLGLGMFATGIYTKRRQYNKAA